MTVGEYFGSGYSYVVSAENWVRNYFKSVGYKMEYTFVQDLVIAEWFNLDNVRKTYEQVKKEYLDDYKAFTEVVMSINMLIWFNDALKKEGVDDRDDAEQLYNDLYFEARDAFYLRWGNNDEACDYFFKCTD